MRLNRFLCALAVVLPSYATAATLPTGFTEKQVTAALSNPTAMQFAPDGRLFICEQGGRLRVVRDGALLSAPFLTVTVNSSGERGLLGVAFDPAYASNHFVYIYYTATTPAVHNRISRFIANGDVAVAGSETVIFELDNLSSATNHNGGALAFGSDGKLYAAVGENANGANAQSMGNVLGKMLRLNKDGTIPADNPFFTSASGKNRAIWALGLRNPFTFAFNPGGAEMFINDVGQSTWEEIDDGVVGANYGWPDTEGATTDPRFKSPRYAYNHSDAGVCAITGGAFYSPLTPQFPSDYARDYFFADYCAGWIRKLDIASGSVTTFATGIASPVDLKVSDDGALYYLARGANAVYRVEFGATAPSITTHPASQTVRSGSPVTFSVRASGPAPLRYQWQRDGADIAGATAQDYTIASVVQADNGARFRARVTNDFGNALSNEAVLTVSTNQAPTGTITQPAAGTLYSGGMVVNYAGTATDPEDGTLAPGAFTWRVDFHHDTHIHPFMAATTGARSGSFTIPTLGETSANVWYRIYLTVTDSGGLTQTTQRDILPRKAQLTLATNPAGLQLKLDGQPVATPLSFDSVVGIVRNIEAVTPQSAGGNTYDFASWSDGGARAHDLSTPAVNTTYTASYNLSAGGGQRGISVNFVGSDGASMGAAESAGVVAKANWNNATGATRSTPLALSDEAGAATGATITWSSDNLWTLPVTDQPGNRRMMKGYLDNGSGGVITVSVAGLAAGAYDVYVYADGDNNGFTRTGTYRISGAGITTTTINLTDPGSTNFNATFTQANNSAGNYVKFSITAGGFTLTATPAAASGTTRRAPINGIQIVPTVATPPGAGDIGINFVGTDGASMGAAESAGVVAKANWNNATGATRSTPLALTDETGAATGATVTWSSNNVWNLPGADQAGNRRMMNGYLDNGAGGAITVTVAGLPAGAYDVYVYADGENGGFTRTGTYRISGAGITTASISLTDLANTNFNGTFTQANNSAGNYVKFSINAGGFTLTATPASASGTTLRAPVNGIQIVRVP